jgi:hypothetical protein
MSKSPHAESKRPGGLLWATILLAETLTDMLNRLELVLDLLPPTTKTQRDLFLPMVKLDGVQKTPLRSASIIVDVSLQERPWSLSDRGLGINKRIRRLAGSKQHETSSLPVW